MLVTLLHFIRISNLNNSDIYWLELLLQNWQLSYFCLNFSNKCLLLGLTIIWEIVSYIQIKMESEYKSVVVYTLLQIR